MEAPEFGGLLAPFPGWPEVDGKQTLAWALLALALAHQDSLVSPAVLAWGVALQVPVACVSPGLSPSGDGRVLVLPEAPGPSTAPGRVALLRFGYDVSPKAHVRPNASVFRGDKMRSGGCDVISG